MSRVDRAFPEFKNVEAAMRLNKFCLNFRSVETVARMESIFP